MKKLKNLFVKKSPFSITISIAMLILTTVGIADTLLLVYNHIYSGGACETLGFLGGSCDTVTQSKYGFVFDIPISIFGLIGYFTLMVLLIFSFFHTGMPFLMFIATFFGLATSLYLVYIQAFILNAWCPLCLISAANFFLLFIFSAMLFSRSFPPKTQKETETPPPPHTASEDSLENTSQKNSLEAQANIDSPSFKFPSLKTVRSVLLIVSIFAFFSLLFFESIRGRQLLKEKTIFSKATPIGCGLRTSAALAATINADVIYFNDIDTSINFDNLEVCKEISVYRMHAINLMLLQQKSSQEENTVAQLLTNLGMTPSLADLVNSPENLKTALSLDTKQAQTTVNEALAKLRNEYAVKLNF